MVAYCASTSDSIYCLVEYVPHGTEEKIHYFTTKTHGKLLAVFLSMFYRVPQIHVITFSCFIVSRYRKVGSTPVFATTAAVIFSDNENILIRSGALVMFV